MSQSPGYVNDTSWLYSAAPQVYIDVYPRYGGSYTIAPDTDNLISCTVNKPLTGAGRFSISLAPGGPAGVEDAISWGQVIVPGSLVVIRSRRGDASGIRMIGIVTTSTEALDWTTPTVTRGTTFVGSDLTWFFQQTSYYTAAAFGLIAAILPQSTAGQAIGAAMKDGTLSALANAYYGTPAQMATAWYNAVMFGTYGLMTNTTFAVGNENVLLNDILAPVFTDFTDITPSGGPGISSFTAFMQSEGTWWAKFQQIFTAPFFELFVATAPSGVYSTSASTHQFGTANVDAGSAYFVARPAPMPYVDSDGNLQRSRWDDLPLNDLTALPFGPLRVTMSQSLDNVANLAAISPTALNSFMFGGSNSGLSSFVAAYGAGIDTDSINQYGWKPQYVNTLWFADWKGHTAQQTATKGGMPQYIRLIANMNAFMMSMYAPQPYLSTAEVTYPLLPASYGGTRAILQPLKNDEPYEFYIVGVQDDYRYSQRPQATTTLTLARGLPQSVYDSDAMLKAVLLDKVRVTNGQFVSHPELTGVQIGTGADLQKMQSEWLPQLSKAFSTKGEM